VYLELWSCRREGISMQDFGENKPHKSDLLEGSEEESGVAAAAATATDRSEFFDASQYAFFGRDLSEDVELGGLDEDDDGGEQPDDDGDGDGDDDAIFNRGDREEVCVPAFVSTLLLILQSSSFKSLFLYSFGCNFDYDSVCGVPPHMV
jgi:hypothetical protein